MHQQVVVYNVQLDLFHGIMVLVLLKPNNYVLLELLQLLDVVCIVGMELLGLVTPVLLDQNLIKPVKLVLLLLLL